MAQFRRVVEAFIASRELEQGALSRLDFWVSTVGDREIAEVAPEYIDAALVILARGRLKGGKRITISAQKPLAGGTVNRYLTQCGWVFKCPKPMKLDSRAFVPPTERILAVARVTWAASCRPQAGCCRLDGRVRLLWPHELQPGT